MINKSLFIIPTYNESENIELIIIDDNSHDNSREIMKNLHSRDSRVKIFFNDTV